MFMFSVDNSEAEMENTAEMAVFCTSSKLIHPDSVDQESESVKWFWLNTDTGTVPEQPTSKMELGRQMAEQDERIQSLKSQGIDCVLILAEMDGKIGTGAASVSAKALKEQGILVFSAVTTGFPEADAIQKKITQKYEELCAYSDVSIPFSCGVVNGKYDAHRLSVKALGRVACLFIAGFVEPGITRMESTDVLPILSGETFLIIEGKTPIKGVIEATKRAISLKKIPDVR